MRWLGSIAVHVVLGGLLLLVGHRASGPPPTAVTVAIVEAPPPQEARGAAPAVASRASPARQKPRARANRSTEPSMRASVLGDVVVEAVGEGGGGGGGGGGGAGGRGVSGVATDPRFAAWLPVALPVAPVSRARPAILVFPSRQTAVEDAALYVAEVIVDDEGFVVGSRLARGFGGPRDVEAGAQVWRFRYSPALDDDGRPIRSTVQQKFAVAW